MKQELKQELNPYKQKEIKEMIYDVFRDGDDYMDYKKLDMKELIRVAGELNYMFGNKYEPIAKKDYNTYTDLNLCLICKNIMNHGYIPCISGEIEREFNGALIGESSLVNYILSSDWRKRIEKDNLKWIKDFKHKREIFISHHLQNLKTVDVINVFESSETETYGNIYAQVADTTFTLLQTSPRLRINDISDPWFTGILCGELLNKITIGHRLTLNRFRQELNLTFSKYKNRMLKSKTLLIQLDEKAKQKWLSST